MGGFGYGGMWALWLLVLAGIGVLIFVVVRLASQSRDGGKTPPLAASSSARAILEERYARGEVDTADFTERVEKLEGR
ncbi:MAG: hypothetical protein CVT68_00905 [Actinobacteria bacterium HGW-Actinobacteria-8]|nr:MAG: hypothetical protein CVT68_00905 [Actinobacteria bacterium HGW-Actinobacteria-8]